MPVDINRLTEGWLELESDPGRLCYWYIFHVFRPIGGEVILLVLEISFMFNWLDTKIFVEYLRCLTAIVHKRASNP